MTATIKEDARAFVERWESGFGAAARGPIPEVRRAALERFAELGFPSTSEEEWRFTNVAPIARRAWAPAPEPKAVARADVKRAGALYFGSWKKTLVVLVNGRFARELSDASALPEGAFAGSLADGLAARPEVVTAHLGRHAAWREHAFTALNTAFLEDGAFVHVPRGAALEVPIVVLHVSVPGAEPSVAHPRTLVVVETGAQARVVEAFVGPAGAVYFTNAVTEIVAGDSAVMDHARVQEESADAFHVSMLEARVGRAAVVRSRSIALGGALTRNDAKVRLADEGGECTLDGLYIATGSQHVDNHTTLDHVKPHCSSREIYRGILDGRSSAVFNGRIIVRPDAQKTDAKQTNKNLLLSDEAQVETKPQLEIYANDVKCTHGATVGRLDDEALFYLRSRGVAAQDARALLTFAFASDIVHKIEVGPVREDLESKLFARFGGRLLAGLPTDGVA